MKFIETDFDGLLIIKHNVFNDSRGYFKEAFKLQKLQDFNKIKLKICQENIVKSELNVLRGLHFQNEPFAQSKLISISHGKILDVAVDIRNNSITYGKYFTYVLDVKNHESIFIPKGFAHGYLTLSDYAIINYKVDNYYKPEMESGISYKDDFLKINWGVNENDLIISNKDRGYKNFKW